MPPLYKPYKAADAVMSESGYKQNAYIALPEWFTTIATPGVATAMGDNYIITADHVFAAEKGMLPVYCFPNTNEGNGELVGDPGAKKTRFTPKIFIQGDNPASLELINNIKNIGVFLFVEKPGCPGQFVQYGTACEPITIDSASNPTGTTLSGKAGWEITFESFSKYFYNGEITEYP